MEVSYEASPQAIAELPYPVKLGAGSYPIEAEYAQSENRHLRGSDSASLLQAEREGSAIAYPGLFELHFALSDNPYYEAARSSSDLVVTGMEATELKIKGYIVLPNGADYARDWNGKLHLDVDVMNGELKKWTASIGSTDQRLDIHPRWTVIVNNKAYLQGQFTIQGQVYTIRLMTQESGSQQNHLSLQLWRGQPDDRSADNVLFHAPFQGNIVIK